MKTFEEISFDWADPNNRAEHIGLALGIDNVVQYILHTYDDVYVLLTEPHTFSDGAEGNPAGHGPLGVSEVTVAVVTGRVLVTDELVVVTAVVSVVDAVVVVVGQAATV